jgi:hypothetical protein
VVQKNQAGRAGSPVKKALERRRVVSQESDEQAAAM